jgi:hypothetical protein
MLLSLIYLKLVQLLKPHSDPVLNRIKETSIWQIFFVFLIALLLHTNAVESVFLTVCLMLVFFGNFILLLGQYLVQYWLRHACVWCGVEGEVAMEIEMEKRISLSTFASASAPGLVSTSAVSTSDGTSSCMDDHKIATDDTDEADRQTQIHSPFHPPTSI